MLVLLLVVVVMMGLLWVLLSLRMIRMIRRRMLMSVWGVVCMQMVWRVVLRRGWRRHHHRVSMAFSGGRMPQLVCTARGTGMSERRARGALVLPF